MKSIQIYLITLITVFFSCKEKQDPYEDHRLQTLTLAYCYFKTGTYWVYEDSATGAIDSVYVYKDRYKTDTIPEGNYYEYDPGLYDWFEYDLIGTYYKKKTNIWANSSWSSERNNHTNICFLVSTDTFTGGTNETPIWISNFKRGGFLYAGKGIIMNTSSFINHENYQNVLVYLNTVNSTEKESPVYYYFAPRVGIVRREIIDTKKVWKLKRHHVIQ